VDLATYLSVLRRRALPLLLCVVAGLAGGIQITRTTPESYLATARALVTLPPSEQTQNTGQQLAGSQLSANLVPTYAQIATSRSVAQKVIQQLDLPLGVGALQAKIAATQQPETLIINITAQDRDPLRAASLADAVTQALAERVNELETGRTSRVQVQLLDHAQAPTTPASPRPRLNVALGLALGLAAGLLLVALLETLDRSVKTSTQGDAAFAAPLLGIVPLRRRSRRELVVAEEGTIESEPYRALRTAVRFTDPDSDLRTLLVTSATPGDGKTTTTANLALALAAGGETVVVIDADLRRAKLAGVFGLEEAVGLSSLVLRTATLDEALQHWRENVWVLPSGRPLPPNPSEVLGSHFMSDVLAELAQRFDVVLIDTPPVLPVTDAVALSTQVDAVLMVARYGATHRGPAAEARRRLDAVGAHVIGYVLNAVPGRETGAYYADYRYDYDKPSRRDPSPAARADAAMGRPAN
jgi:capsular exopolysaccharide synthesis family protein